MPLPPKLPPSWPPAFPTLGREDLRELAQARALLENPGLTARVANALGRPIEKGIAMLPTDWSNTVQQAAHAALTKALAVAVSSLGRKTAKPSSERLHKLLVGASGGVGGLFGLLALPVELPVSTTIMLRSIADIARSEGHDLRSPCVRLSCLEVFALGGRPASDDATESAYWAVRAALAQALSEAANYLARKKVVEETAPVILRLITGFTSRFGVIVSEQAAAMAVPVLGAAGGAAINVLFMSHFQDMARGHFIVQRLEAIHGTEKVRATYDSLGRPGEGRP